MVVSLGIYVAVDRWASHLAKESFGKTAADALHGVRGDISNALDATDAIAAFIRSSQEIEPAEFRDYTIRLLKRRGVGALGIAEHRGKVVRFEPQSRFPGMVGSDLASTEAGRSALSPGVGGMRLYAMPFPLEGLDPSGAYLALLHLSQNEVDGAQQASGPDRPPIVFGILDMTEIVTKAVPSDGPPVWVSVVVPHRLERSAHSSGYDSYVEEFRLVHEVSLEGIDLVLVASSPMAPWSVGFGWVRWAGLFLGLAIASLVAAYLRATGAHSRWLREEKERSEQTFRGAFDVASHGMALVGPEGEWLEVNAALCGMLGYTAEELQAMDFQSVTHPEDLPADLSSLDRLLRREIETYRSEKRYIHKKGQVLWVDLSVASVFNSVGALAYFVCQVIDLSHRKEAEAKLLQAQKMESIGQLTGGVAHDFNNLLTVVLGNLELAERRVQEDARLRSLLAAAREAAGRGATLTKQLLAFARRRHLEPRTVHLREALAELERLIRRTIGEGVTLSLDFPADLWPVRVDPVQLESAVLNLAVNARDAIGGEGTIAVRAENRSLDGTHAEMDGVESSDYVLLSVTDDGQGIAPEDLGKVVEPFFTTKESGKGSGLGLSMVYGFMEQSGGHLKILSTVGTGSTVKLYLPRVPAQEGEQVASSGPQAIPMARAGEKVLVVEDQLEVRELAASFLEELGYAVAQAESGKSALRLLEQDKDLQVVLSDVVMPGELDGFELARVMAHRFPGIPVVLASGYRGDRPGNEEAGGDNVLLKPYSLRSLGERLRTALDSRKAAG